MTDREAALEILSLAVQRKQRISDARDDFFVRYSQGKLNRGKITALTSSVIRWQGRIDLWLSQVIERPLRKLQPRLLIILRIAVFELLIDRNEPEYGIIHSAVDLAGKRVGKHTKGLVNAVLRRVSTISPAERPDAVSDWDWYSFPRWIWERWHKRYGDDPTEQLAAYFNTFPQLTIRRNQQRITTDKLITTLAGAGIEIEELENSPLFFKVVTGGNLILKHELFKTGAISFQDRAAGAVVEILDPHPGEVILDICAAPGTKALYVAELIDLKSKDIIFASDSDPRRVEQGIADITRHGYSINWAVKDATTDQYPLADAVIVDAPCTGTGVIARRPDIRWRRSVLEIDQMADLQLKILVNASKYVKQGGRLVYATCSMEPEENWNLVKAFLKLHPHFTVENIDQLVPSKWINENQCMETFPPRDQVDGIFAVRLSNK